MSSDDRHRPPRGALLPVRTRRTVGNEQREHDASVHCPLRATSIPVGECLACSDCEGTTTGPEGDYLRCAHPAAERAALQDLMRRPMFASAADRTPLSSIVTGDVFCVSPDLGLDELADLFVEHNIGGAPVVDGQGRPIGVVSKSDLVRTVREREDAGGRRRWPRGSLAGPDGDETVGDMMMPIAFTLPETATVSQAAALMAFEGVHRIPVVAADGQVVGVVSSLDIARWLAQNDGYLAPHSSTLARRAPPEDE